MAGIRGNTVMIGFFLIVLLASAFTLSDQNGKCSWLAALRLVSSVRLSYRAVVVKLA